MHCCHGEFALGHRCGSRHGRRPGFGGVFGAMGGRGYGWYGFRAGRKLSGDHLQLLILALLTDRPYHGYEIIRALEERSGGFYSPSPGMVYPALTYLEELGYASIESEGSKKLYRITGEGRAHLERNRRVVDAIFAQLAWIGAKMDHVREVFSREGPHTDEAPPGWGADLREARRRLRGALSGLDESSDEEQRRVAAILERAAREIRGA